MSKFENIETMGDLKITIEYQEVLKKYANRCRDIVESKSPKKSGEYARGWKAEVEGEGTDSFTIIVRNTTRPALTWLLENGHQIVNRKKGVGWASAHPHIEPSYKAIRGKLLKDIQNVKFKVETKG